MCNNCFKDVDFDEAHRHCTANKVEIQKSKQCGCFFCVLMFPSADVVEYINEPAGGETAFCPICGIDSVIGDASGIALTEHFLKQMNKEFFGE